MQGSSNKARAEEVLSWKSEFADGGATKYFKMTRHDNSYPPYSSRWDMLIYLVSSSPKLRYICRLLHATLFAEEGVEHKTLIFTQWPLEQWYLGAFLELLGLDYWELRSGMGNTEKTGIMERFNTPEDTAKVMITSFKATAVGVNLQHACHRIIMMSFPENIPTALQSISRVHRLGQLVVQLIWILSLVDSYDIYLQHKVCEKYNQQLYGEAKLVEKEWTDAELYSLELKVRNESTAKNPYTRFQLQHAIKQEEMNHLSNQAYSIIGKLLGFRTSRKDMGRMNLANSHFVPNGPTTPGKVRDFVRRSASRPGLATESLSSPGAEASSLSGNLVPVQTQSSLPVQMRGLNVHPSSNSVDQLFRDNHNIATSGFKAGLNILTPGASPARLTDDDDAAGAPNAPSGGPSATAVSGRAPLGATRRLGQSPESDGVGDFSTIMDTREMLDKFAHEDNQDDRQHDQEATSTLGSKRKRDADPLDDADASSPNDPKFGDKSHDTSSPSTPSIKIRKIDKQPGASDQSSLYRNERRVPPTPTAKTPAATQKTTAPKKNQQFLSTTSPHAAAKSPADVKTTAAKSTTTPAARNTKARDDAKKNQANKANAVAKKNQANKANAVAKNAEKISEGTHTKVSSTGRPRRTAASTGERRRKDGLEDDDVETPAG